MSFDFSYSTPAQVPFLGKDRAKAPKRKVSLAHHRGFLARG